MLKDRYIVLVEDDEIMGGSLLQRLELEGAKVLWLKQMVRALGAIRTPKKPIDAVICDIGLPDGSGLDLLRIMKARRERSCFQRFCAPGHPHLSCSSPGKVGSVRRSG